MKTSLCCAIVLALGCCCIAEAQSAPGSRVVVIDLSKVFEKHPSFKAQMEAMKEQVTQFEGQLQQRGKEIQQVQNNLKQFQASSNEYKQLEGKILKLQAEGQIAAAQKKKEFLTQEAQIYFNAYNEIVGEVAKFAEQNGISIVVRFNSEPIAQESRQSVLDGVNRAVVYQRSSNITNAIIERLVRNNSVPNAQAGAVPQGIRK